MNSSVKKRESLRALPLKLFFENFSHFLRNQGNFFLTF